MKCVDDKQDTLSIMIVIPSCGKQANEMKCVDDKQDTLSIMIVIPS